MNIKKISLIALAVVALFSCKPRETFVIDGKFVNPGDEKMVYLFSLKNSEMVAIDSTNLSDKGLFKFERKVPTVDFFKVVAGDYEYMLIAKNGDDIKLEADLADQSMAYKISGAQEVEKLSELNSIRNEFAQLAQKVQSEFDNLVTAQPQNRDMILEQLRPRYESYLVQMNDKILKFSQDNKGTLAGFYAMSTLSPMEFENELVAYSDAIKDALRGNETVDDFVRKMTLLKTVQVGQPAPAFTINSLDGKPVTLEDYKGKYVLLDFWASWCQPCRIENPNVVRAYQTFKDKNFDILGISLDTDINAWKTAIKADNLTWQQVGELKDFNGEMVRNYQVQAIPTSYLLDPKGTIIAKNLRAEELIDFLAKTLK